MPHYVCTSHCVDICMHLNALNRLHTCMQIFAALTALCGAIAISKLEVRYIEGEAKYIQRNPGYW